MDFGYYLTNYFPDSSTQSFQELCADSVQQAVAAEELGFSSISIPEHHFANYLTIPSPLLYAVQVAAATKKIPIITAVLVLPFYDPLRLAGEICLADNLMRGRLGVGVGRGAFRYEFERFGQSFAESRDRFSEFVNLLDRLLTETEVTHDGQYYPILEPVTIMPRPAQEPRPEFWIAALGEGGIRWAVANGHNLLTTPLRDPFEVAVKQADWFMDESLKLPATDATQPKHHMLRNVYVSKNQRDLDEKSELLLNNHRRFVNLFETAGTVRDGMVVPLEVNLRPDEAAHNVIFGSPDEVAERLQLHADMGVDGVQVNMSFGAGHSDIMNSLELFASDVMPQLSSNTVSTGSKA
jgi:alkanesulfonate monooxygenase SsuD/methylene tetrahydromethanopterin reductase-like flavin-dependent oxidoreductase (luciferase family)